jgi:hypothetical protein
MRELRTHALAAAVAAVACVVAPVLVAANSGSPLTVGAVVVMFTVAPGAALLPWLTPAGRRVEVGLVVGVSLAATTLVAQGMLWIDAWTPTVAVYAVAAICLFLVIVHLARGRYSLPQ